MLYIYYTESWERTEKEAEAIRSCGTLKQWNEGCYIGKEKSIVVNGVEVISDDVFSEFVWNSMEDEMADIPLINVVSIESGYAIDCLVNGLDDEYCKYSDRIYNANNPYKEAVKIMNESVLGILLNAVDEMQNKINRMK